MYGLYMEIISETMYGFIRITHNRNSVLSGQSGKRTLDMLRVKIEDNL